jgi:hypothetical protein
MPRGIQHNQTYNGEFDPGSGLTLAAGLIHASRTVTGVAIPADEWRTGA